ncbi:MAG: hypothetical protein ACJAZM_002987 [Cyclobacteriaceae bacterium]
MKLSGFSFENGHQEMANTTTKLYAKGFILIIKIQKYRHKSGSKLTFIKMNISLPIE